MGDRLGENIQREWDEDPQAPELWDALRLFKDDPATALARLTALADSGSALAMVYLGWCHYKGRWRAQDPPQALQWLTTAERAGHLHAGHWLSRIYRKDELGLGKTIAGWWMWLRVLRPWVSYIRTYPTSDRLRLGSNPYQMADRMKQCVEGRGAVS